ncbi:hypothetical protein JCM17823_01350 [Halorubrum gandharaense]
MPTAPVLELATETVQFDPETEPLLVDPSQSLFEAIIDAWIRDGRKGSDGWTDATADAARPTLTVLARPAIFEAATDGFHEASRLADPVETGAIRLHTLAGPQPAAVIATREEGFSVVEAGGERYRVGNDPTLRQRYADTLAAADSFTLRTPSRRRIHEAFRNRCGEAVADDVLHLLDTNPAPDADHLVGARERPYLAGARHGVLHYELCRAGEEAGLGSPSTFSKVKSRLVDAGLLTTEKVDQPVGRPRQRLVASDALADAPMEDVVAVARETLRE